MQMLVLFPSMARLSFIIPFQIQVNATCDVARNVAQEAAKRKVKAYVRLTHPFYETSSKTPPDESVDIKPKGDLGIWWHETLRILANIPEYVCSLVHIYRSAELLPFSLNLVIVRAGFVFGPYVDFGISACGFWFYRVINSPRRASSVFCSGCCIRIWL
jgi:hypothetical protein